MDNQHNTGMFKGANAKLFQFAVENRLKPTQAEALLWEALKGNKLEGRKFRRQHPLGNYILDFYCHAEKLGIEVDGKYHENENQQIADLERTKAIATENIKIIRFSNEQVIVNIDSVVEEIKGHFRPQSI
jgi:very-short-patch-repair endonuclease